MNQPDYGLPNCTPTSPPRLKWGPAYPHMSDDPCPRCDGRTVFLLEIDVDQPLLKGGKGIGVYSGCAGCGWASPMAIRSLEAK